MRSVSTSRIGLVTKARAYVVFEQDVDGKFECVRFSSLNAFLFFKIVSISSELADEFFAMGNENL